MAVRELLVVATVFLNALQVAETGDDSDLLSRSQPFNGNVSFDK